MTNESSKPVCCACGETKAYWYEPDPFILEVYPEDNPEPEWWCDACYSDRKDEV